MDFRSLQYFVVTAQELNITRAASLLNISQPPLSSQIRHLEEEFGAELFQRSRTGLKLTPAGEVLYRRAKQILELAQHTHEDVRNYSGQLSGNLRFGSVEGRAPFLLARLLAGFHEEFPLVTYIVRSGGSDDILEQLEHHLIDLAVVAAPYNEVRYEGISLGRQPWVAIIPKEHPFASLPGDTISLSQLVKETLIVPERVSRVRAIEQWFMEKDLNPSILFRTSNYISALALVEQNAGICIFPQCTGTPNPHTVTRLINDPPKYAEYFLVTKKEEPLSELAESFLDFVQDLFSGNTPGTGGPGANEEEFPLPEDAELL